MVRGVYIDPALIESKAYLLLTGFAPQLLLIFLKRRRMRKVGRRKGKVIWVIENNGEIILTYDYALKKWGITKPRFQRALKQLIEVGFLDVSHSGGGLLGDCSKYAISDRWKRFGKDDFISKTLIKDTRGFGFTSDNWEERTGKKRSCPNSGNEFVPFGSNENVTGLRVSRASSGNKNVTGQNKLKSVLIQGVSRIQCYARVH